MCDLLQGDPQSCPNTIAKRLLSVQNGYLCLPSVSFIFKFFILAALGSSLQCGLFIAVQRLLWHMDLAVPQHVRS